MNTNNGRQGLRFLESVSILNQVAASTAVTKGVRVPAWANNMVIFIFFDAAAGTGKGFDFSLGIPDFGSETLLGAPTDANDVATFGDAAWDGITRVTGAGPYVIRIAVGPEVADDDTGSATASCEYGVKCAALPPVFTYTYTTLDGGDDCDYTFRVVVQFKK
jgi:hypothetical protein